MADHTLTLADATSASTLDAAYPTKQATGGLYLPVQAVVGYIYDVDFSLNLPVLEVEGTIPEVCIGEGELELPLIDASGEINDISFDLNLPGLLAEGNTGDEIDLDIPGLELEGTALNGSVAAGDVVLPTLQVDAITGLPISITLPVYQVEGTGLTGQTAEGKLELECLAVTGTGSTPLDATGDLVLPALLPRGTGVGENIVTGTITVPLVEVSGNIYGGLLATGDITLPALVVTSEDATVSTEATGALTLPLLSVYAEIPEVVVVVEADGASANLLGFALVMNLENEGVTEYSNFPFNSFACFNGRYLAANSSGIYELTGDNDAGDDIDAVFRTPQEDANAPYLKRPEDVYIGAKSDDDLAVSVLVDGNVEYKASNISGKTTGIVTRKSKVGKGAKSRYWAVQVENVNGCDFTVESMELNLKAVTRKV